MKTKRVAVVMGCLLLLLAALLLIFVMPNQQPDTSVTAVQDKPKPLPDAPPILADKEQTRKSVEPTDIIPSEENPAEPRVPREAPPPTKPIEKKEDNVVRGPSFYLIKVVDAETNESLSGWYFPPNRAGVAQGSIYQKEPFNLIKTKKRWHKIEERKRERRGKTYKRKEFPKEYEADRIPGKRFTDEFTVIRPTVWSQKFETIIYVEGYAPEYLPLGETPSGESPKTDDVLTVRMQTGAVLEGSVVTANGSGVAFVKLEIAQRDFYFQRTVYTDKNGYFRITGVSKDRLYTINVCKTRDSEWMKCIRGGSTRVTDFKPDGKPLTIIRDRSRHIQYKGRKIVRDTGRKK